MSTYEARILIEDQIEELTQNAKFLHSNYDFHHKNNEEIILNEEIEKLRQAGKKFSRFIGKIKNMRKLMDEGQRMCEQADEIFKEMQIPNEEETNDDDTDKENKFLIKKHVTFNEK